jgi:hypothetical protein
MFACCPWSFLSSVRNPGKIGSGAIAEARKLLPLGDESARCAPEIPSESALRVKWDCFLDGRKAAVMEKSLAQDCVPVDFTVSLAVLPVTLEAFARPTSTIYARSLARALPGPVE